MTLKKLTSVLLCIAMVLSLASITVFADATVHEVTNDTELATAIKNAVAGDTVKLAAGEYTGGFSVGGKSITLEGTVGDNGELLTNIVGGNPAIAVHSFNGTIKNIKITDAFRGFYGEPCRTVTFDNVSMTGVTYGFHLIAYSDEPVWTVENCYVDASWANSFGTYQCEGATIIVKNNEFVSTSPYYTDGSGSPLVNTFSPKTTIEDNVFGTNAKILIRDSAKDGTVIGTNYYEDGFENALYEDCAEGVTITTYYADKEMTEVVEVPVSSSAVAKIGDVEYTTLQNAVDAAISGAEIDLISDIDLTETLKLSADDNIILDLNGYTISQSKAQTEGYQMILNDGELTINDSGVDGKISYADIGSGGEYISDTIYNRGTLVINDGIIENISSATVASNGYPHAVDTYSGIRDTSVTINGGTVYCAEYSAVRMFCCSATYQADLVINEGATIKGAVDMQNGTKNAALGSLTVNGGTFETTTNANNIRFANWNGGATEYGIDAEIKDGSFHGGITTAYVPSAANWNHKIITGGTFSSDVTAYLADGVTLAAQADGSYLAGALPNAEVTNLGAITVTANEGSYQFGSSYYIYDLIGGSGLSSSSEPFDMGIAMQFTAKDTPEEAANNAFGEYTTDFFIQINGIANGSFVGNGCYLAGYYPSYGAWVKIPLDNFTIENGKVYPVITSAGFDFSYVNICDSVQDFLCGIYFPDEVLVANPDMTVALTLGLSETAEAAVAGEFITVDEPYVYTVDDFNKKLTNWDVDSDAGFYLVDDTKYGMMRFLFRTNTDEAVTDYGIKYINGANIGESVNGENVTGNTVSESGDVKVFHGDIVNIPENVTEGTYYAAAYIITESGETIWSEIVDCAINWLRQFTNYQP